jgi:hypothetical protein
MKTLTRCTLKTGMQLAKVGYRVVNLRSNLSNVSRAGITTMKRAVRKNWRAAEDLVDDVSRSVKKQPLRALGITFGLAFGMGTLAGALTRRK